MASGSSAAIDVSPPAGREGRRSIRTTVPLEPSGPAARFDSSGRRRNREYPGPSWPRPSRRTRSSSSPIDSLAFGGNGVARLNGFVVFVRRGLAGRHGSRARDEGAAATRRGARDRGPQAGPAARRRAVPALPRVRRLPLPGSRVRGAGRARRRSRSRTRCAGSAGSRSRRSRTILPAEEIFHYRNKLEYSFTQTRGRADARLPQGRSLGRGARDRALLADDRPRQCDPQRGARVGARRPARRLRPGRALGLPPPSRRA